MKFLNNLDKYHSNICLIDENKKTISYNDLLSDHEKISKDLKSRSLIFTLSSNHIDFITTYVSFLKKGLVQVLLNSDIKKDYLQNLISKYLPEYIFLPNSRVIEFKNCEIILNFNNHSILKLNKDKNYTLNTNLALLLSTSGSTGSNKLVKISYENLNDNTKNIISFLKIDSTHRTITTMPPSYTYGLSIINTHLISGASIVVNSLTVMEKKFWILLNETKVSSFGGVPFFYEMLKKLSFSNMSLPSIKYFTQAGGHLKKELAEYYFKYALANKKLFYIMYGQVEATSRISYMQIDINNKEKIGSIGKPIPGGKIELRNNKSENDKDGEIVYSGKNVSMGYTSSFKDLKSDDNKNRILKTGDIGTKDEDGYFYITGRKIRDVKVYGHRVNLDEIEKILEKKSLKCFCIGSTDLIKIFYSNQNYKSSEIINFISNSTNINKKSFKTIFIKEIPVNQNGKISYNKLKTL
jgi:acyl-coenzyme A synthetase/AMP-(fatty) acid ligase